MSLPRYHDDPSPSRPWNRYQDRLIRYPDGSLRVWRLWASLYDAIKANPALPLTAIRDIAQQAFFYEDDEMGYVPRISVPVAAVIGIVRQAIRTNPGRTRPPVPAKFKQIVDNTFDPPEKITGEKLDFDEPTQLSESVMPDQKGSLKTILQGGVAPFTNMRPANIKLGDSVYSRKADVMRDLTSMHGTASFGFGFRFTSDVSDERKSAIMVFRHNKKGMDYSETANSGSMTVTDSGYHWTNVTGSSYTAAFNSKVYEAGDTVVFPSGTIIAATDAAYPQKLWKHAWGYGDTVKVFPTQYSNSGSLNTIILDGSDVTKNVVTPFEHVPSGVPQIYLSALNRADLEDMSCQLNPLMLGRQGEVDWLQNPGTSNAAESQLYDMRYPRNGAQRGISKLRFGQLWLDNKHTHNQFSALYAVNKLDDDPAPKGNNDADYGNTYQGAMGTSFKYNAVLKTGGCQFTCVNRGGSGCNVDVHLFKMKKKHIDSQGYFSDLTWSKISSPYEEAYMKRAHEIITAENLRGRDPLKDDIWTKPKYPLLPGSRLMNAEDTLLNRVSKTSYYIPSQGRKNINLRFPGAKYDPCEVCSVFDGGTSPDYSPDYDEFTYFCLYSVTGEKSSAQYSTKNTSGTFLISLADLFTTGSQAVVLPPSGVAVPSGPWLPSIKVGWTPPPSGNVDYDKWVLTHANWGYSTEEYMFYTDEWISMRSKDVTGWDNFSLGPLPHILDEYFGKVYLRRVRCPLPSLSEWLAANYAVAYNEQGRDWKPSHPKIRRTRRNYPPLRTQRLLASWVYIESVEWPVYESQPAPDPVDPPVDVTPVFDPVDVEVMVRTNFFFLFSVYLSCIQHRCPCWSGFSW